MEQAKNRGKKRKKRKETNKKRTKKRTNETGNKMNGLQALKEFDLYDDTHRLRITVSNMKNGNSRRKLEEIKTSVLKGLSNIASAPGAQFAPVPPRHQIVSSHHVLSCYSSTISVSDITIIYFCLSVCLSVSVCLFVLMGLSNIVAVLGA